MSSWWLEIDCVKVFTQQKLAISTNQGTPPPKPPANCPALCVVIHLPRGSISHKAHQEAAFLQWGVGGGGKSLNCAESRISSSQSLTLTCVNPRWTKPPEAWLDFPFSPTGGLLVCRQLMFNAINQMGFDTTADDLAPSTTLQPLPLGSSEGTFRFMKITHYYLTGSAAELVMKRVSGSEMWVSTARLERIFLRKHTWRMWRGVGLFPLNESCESSQILLQGPFRSWMTRSLFPLERVMLSLKTWANGILRKSIAPYYAGLLFGKWKANSFFF